MGAGGSTEPAAALPDRRGVAVAVVDGSPFRLGAASCVRGSPGDAAAVSG
jgi:hypothetical protein